MTTSPYGFWTSPVTSDFAVADSIRLEQVALDGDVLYWSETQPQKRGRSFVYRITNGGEPEPVTPDDENGFSVRTRVHEYGGGSFAVTNGAVFFSNDADQRLYLQDGDKRPRPISPPPTAGAAALSYADGVVDRRRGRLICIREDHARDGEVVNAIVSVDLSGLTPQRVLVSGAAFYSTPRLDLNGSRLAWLSWNHPDMPWVRTEAWVGDLRPRDRACATGRGWNRRINLPAGMVARRRPLFRIGSGLWLVESLSRTRWVDRADGANGRRVRTAAVAVRHIDLRLRVRRSPDLMLRPRRRLDAGQD